MTQRQLAQAAGLSIGVIRDLEQGLTVAPRPGSMRRLADALGLAAPPESTGSSGGRAGLGLCILGTVTAWRDGVSLAVGPARRRAVLGLLAASFRQTVQRAQISNSLWGEAPPPHAVTMIQSHISALRRTPDPGHVPQARSGLIASSGSGYRLDLGDGQLDLHRFQQLAYAARAAAAQGDLAVSCQAWDHALALWRGDPLSDTDLPATHPVVRDLARMRDRAIVEYAETAARVRSYDGPLLHLQQMVEREPFHERALACLLIALAGTGQHAAALLAFDQARRRLRHELGLLPGPALLDAHAQVLHRQVPSASRAGHGFRHSQRARTAPSRVGQFLDQGRPDSGLTGART
jgi:DNA-binding SARP family transcriptional activator